MIKNIKQLFDYFVKYEVYVIIIATISISLFEVFTLSLFFPLIFLIFEKKSIGINFLDLNLDLIYEYKNFFFIFSFFIFLFSFIFQFLLRVIRQKIILNIYKRYNNLYFSNLIKIEYNEFKKIKISEVINSLNVYIDKIISGVLESVFTLLSSIIFVTILTAFLLWVYKFYLIYCLIFIFITFFIYYKLFGNLVNRESTIQTKSQQEKAKKILDIFNFFKYYKFNSKSNFLLKDFNKLYHRIYNSTLLSNSILSFPKTFVEIIVLVIIFLVVYLTVIFNLNFDYLVLHLSIILFVSYKVLPHVILILTSIKRININKDFIKIVISQFNFLKNSEEILDQKYVNFNKKILIKNLNIFINKKKLLRISNIKIQKNEKILIHGNIGVGKSTVGEYLSGLRFNKKNKIFIDDKKLSNSNLLAYRNLFSLYTSSNYLFMGSIKDNIILDKPFRKKLFDKVSKLCALDQIFKNKKINEYFKINSESKNLSEGQKQIICLARVLYEDKQIIILDEPTSHLNFYLANKIINQLISIKDKTIFIITHDKNIIKKFSKRIHLIN
jgi:ABC-type bacteriocin/lantibiotic exporter with double-glycine peptidase domain